MSNKTGIVVALLLVVILTAGGSWFFFVKNRRDSSVLSAVLPQSGIIVKSNLPYKDILKKGSSGDVWQHLKAISVFGRISTDFELLDSLAAHDLMLSEYFQKQIFWLAFVENGSKSEAMLFLETSGQFEANKWVAKVEELAAKHGTVEMQRYAQTKLYAFHHKKRERVYYFAQKHGVFIAGSSEILVQESLRQMSETAGLLQNMEFMNLIKSSGTTSDANVYIQSSHCKGILQSVFNNKRCNVEQYANWFALDVQFKNRVVLLNGLNSKALDESKTLALLNSQKALSNPCYEYVPALAEGFFSIALSDKNQYYSALDRYSDKKVKHSLSKELFSALRELPEKEITAIFYDENSYVLAMRGTGNNAVSDIRQQLEKSDSNVFVKLKNYEIDAQASFPVYSFEDANLASALFGSWFNDLNFTNAAFFNDFLIFGSDVEASEKFIYNNLLKKTLEHHETFEQFSDYLTSRANLFFFSRFTGNGGYLKRFVSDKSFDFFSKNQALLSNYYGIGWQLGMESGLPFNNTFLAWLPGEKIDSDTEWETRLEADVRIKPVIVINHTNQEKEIFVQDTLNNIYLINRSGRIIWKKQLEAPIMSEVVQVDYYKNGKLQYLFNTSAKLYLLDRNGNPVERYPISLESEATTGISVFDYDNRRDYRIFVPQKNNKVELYTLDGRKVTGWAFDGTDGPVVAPVQYFSDNRKDYIVFADSSRVYILDRQGRARVKIKEKFRPSKGNAFVFQSSDSQHKARLVRTNVTGEVYYLYLDGTLEKKIFEKFSNEHRFDYVDLSANGERDYVFIDSNKVSVYNSSGKLQWNYSLKCDIENDAAYFVFAREKRALGLLCSTEQKIFLINQQGVLVKGFPLIGNSMFSITSLNPGNGYFNLLVGGRKSYLYNYRIN